MGRAGPMCLVAKLILILVLGPSSKVRQLRGIIENMGRPVGRPNVPRGKKILIGDFLYFFTRRRFTPLFSP